MGTQHRSTAVVATPEQQKALASPLRLEIHGHFVDRRALSARELAERMGRSASSIYYHLDLLVEVGLLRKAGRGPRGESLYEAAVSTLALEADDAASGRAVLRTMSAAFRMAERDLEEALPLGERGREGGSMMPEILATRLHFRAGQDVLEEVRSHLRAALDVIERELQKEELGPEDGPLHSLTLALLPLRGRSDREEGG